MTHCRSTLEKSRARCASGRAIFITVRSSTIISWASPTRPRISHRRGSGPAAAVVGVPGGRGVLAFVSLTCCTYLEVPSPLRSRYIRIKRRRNLRSQEPGRNMVQPGRCHPVRPLRRDAEQNRQRILRGAAEVFTTRGLQASLDDVARQAGVGVGTVYRRFPDKEALVEALFEERIAELVGLAEEALAVPDSWEGLVQFLRRAGAALAGDRGLRQILMFADYGRNRVERGKARMQPVVTRLVQRA